MKVVWVYFEQDNTMKCDLRLFSNQSALRKYVARRKKELADSCSTYSGYQRLKLRRMENDEDIENIVATMEDITGNVIRVWLEEVIA